MPRVDPSVLIVEDDPDVAEAMQITLADEGYPAVVAGDGLAALKFLRAHPTPPLILLDWNMAPMNGPDFLAALAKEPGPKDAAIYLLTADVRPAEKARTPGVVGYLSKPVDLDALFKVVAQHCA